MPPSRKAPLVIDFSVVPGNGSPKNAFITHSPEGCGYQGVVVGQEGYARTFSTENPKRMVFTKAGRCPCTLYGIPVDVNPLTRMKTRIGDTRNGRAEPEGGRADTDARHAG